MIDLSQYEVWFVTGSQHLYGDEALRLVADDAREIGESLNGSEHIPVNVVYKDVLTTTDAIKRLCMEADSAPACIGMITWMHTFSPAKMWIAGLKNLDKPFLHLHTQHNRKIPWSKIDMDFMNLNQSAHGGREFGFIGTRLGIGRKVVVGYWQDKETVEEIGVWTRAACAWSDSQNSRIARFGDNMRNVAVTEGDKVEAEITFGYSVNGYGIGDLVEYVRAVQDADVESLLCEYDDMYEVAPAIKEGGEKRDALREAARIELGMLSFLQEGGFTGFTTTFENLYGLPQLPGLAVQRLMARGYGFGAEGDWKTAALLRAMKVMAAGLEGGTSFMEDYTYHLDNPAMKVLGAHMLEVCESIAEDRPLLEIEPLDIGGKADPARLVFNAPPGNGVNATIIDLGHRFRMIVNDVRVVRPDQPLPKLPVAHALWEPEPDLRTAAGAWILAGGAHHTGFSMAVNREHLVDFAEMAGIECIIIDKHSDMRHVKESLRWNEAYYK